MNVIFTFSNNETEYPSTNNSKYNNINCLYIVVYRAPCPACVVFKFCCSAAVFMVSLNCIGIVNVERSDLFDLRFGHCPSSQFHSGKGFSNLQVTGQIKIL